jgi:sulfonate transport system ATP-binding protein
MTRRVPASPGRIKAELSVALPRPRGNGLTETPGFQQLRARLLDLIREKSLRAMGNEVEPTGGRRIGRDPADAIGAARN